MRLHTTTGIVETSGLTETTNFSIKVNAKAFRILLDGLYADKVAAVIRELSTNAYDAHLAIGRGDKPFTVRLPTIFDPTYVVRDYGVAMTHEATMRLMSTVFESTKDNSNTQVGAFGLGSKSPFSLVDTFSLTVWKDGEQRMYSAYFGGDGVPAIALLGREPSTEAQGVEFTMTIDPKDVGAFRERAHRILRWFPTIPEVYENGTRVKIEAPGVLVSGNGWHLLGHQRTGGGPYHATQYASGGALARQGCVVYPLTASSIPNLPPHYAELLQTPILIDFPIGTLDVAASREALSYEPTTCANILARLNSVSDEVQAHYGKAIQDAPTLWEAGRKRLEVFRASNLPTSLINLINKTMWQGKVSVDSVSMAKLKASLGAQSITFRPFFWNSARIRSSDIAVYFNDAADAAGDRLHIEYGEDDLRIYFTVNGARPTYEGRRIREHFRSHFQSKGQILVCVLEDEAHRQAILDQMGNPPEAHWTRDLPEPVMPSRPRSQILRGTTKKEEVKVRRIVKLADGTYTAEPEAVVPLDGAAYYLITKDGYVVGMGSDPTYPRRQLVTEHLARLKDLDHCGYVPSDAPAFLISTTYETRLTKFGAWNRFDLAIAARAANLAEKMFEESEAWDLHTRLDQSNWIELLSRDHRFSKLATDLGQGPLHMLNRSIQDGTYTLGTKLPEKKFSDWAVRAALREIGFDVTAAERAATERLNKSPKIATLVHLLRGCDTTYPLVSGHSASSIRHASTGTHVLQYIEAIDMLAASKALARAATAAAKAPAASAAQTATAAVSPSALRALAISASAALQAA